MKIIISRFYTRGFRPIFDKGIRYNELSILKFLVGLDKFSHPKKINEKLEKIWNYSIKSNLPQIVQEFPNLEIIK